MRTYPVFGLAAILLIGFSRPAFADLDVVREVIIAPKHGRVLANIGSVNRSYNIRMVRATVDIRIGPVPEQRDQSLHISVRAHFVLKNESENRIELTVGFPVSNSEYSAFGFDAFHVVTDGEKRSVFNRITGYPRRFRHHWVSGPDKEAYRKLPDFPESGISGDRRLKTARTIYGEQNIGQAGFHNLMVWAEAFAPDQVRTIEVRYAISIPLQKNRWRKKRVKGNHKGIWPQEANNLPIGFLKSIPGGRKYYFFDYYLVSGASWKGTIGREVVRLAFHSSWRKHSLFSNRADRLIRDEKSGLNYAYILCDEEPAENLFFAVAKPGF